MKRLLAIVLVAACGTKSTPAPSGVPQRIVSQTVDGDETLWALGEDVRARVVGISKMADDERYSPVAGVWPTAVPRIPGTSEALIAATPDLVVISEFSAAETRALLANAGIQTLALNGYDGFDDYRERVRAIAKAVGDIEGGAAVLAEFETRLAEASSSSATSPTILSYVEGNVPGANTTFDEEARAAGYTNLPAREGLKGHNRIGLEQIVAWNPDYIVIQCTDDCPERAAAFAKEPGIASTTAAKRSQILPINSALLLSTGATMPKLVAELAAGRSAD